jgi:hypothetical protein
VKLLDCLAAQTWRGLQAISRANRLGFDTNLNKEQAVQRLAAWLGGDEHLQCLTELSPEARGALRELLAAGGQMDGATFARRFGSFRPYRPWRTEAPRTPWTEPQTATETLVYRGLVLPVTLGRDRHRRRAFVLPKEFHQAVAAYLSLTLPAPLDTAPVFPAPSLPLDLLTFLGFLQREDIRPIWGRWLPPTALRALNRLLTVPEDLTDVRSERQARRIPFLHFLAEAAGLTALTGDYLKPSPQADLWLAQPLAARIAALWQAWQQEADDGDGEARWKTYRLAGWSAPAPTDRFARLCRALSSFPADCALPGREWPAALGQVEPTLLRPTPIHDDWIRLSADQQTEWLEMLEAVVYDLVSGPLTWFGVFAPVEENDDGEQGPRADPAVALLQDLRPARLAFTPLGAALVGRDDGAWPTNPPPEPLHLASLSHEAEEVPAVLCLAPPGLPWPGRYSLAAFVAPQPGAPGRYLLTRPELLRALQRGYTWEGIIALLESLSGEPLPLPVFALLDKWGAAYGEVTIRSATLLQVRDPALLSQLAGTRRLRAFLGETFSNRVVSVDGSRLLQLLRALERRGLMPRVEAGLTDQASPARDELAPAERALIVAALELYARLTEGVPDAPPPPFTILDRWAQNLTPAERDAAKRAVQTVMERLHRAGRPGVRRPHLPTPTGPALERLEVAIAAGEAVTITYYTAGRDHTSTRQVTPLRLEWRGERAYCVAHCHLRGAERVFRVDRIVEIE